MRKRIFTYAIIILISFFWLTACGDEEEETTPQVQPPAEITQEEPKKDTTKVEPAEKQKPKETLKQPTEIPDVYTIEQGETLASIAKKFYGDPQKWFNIFVLNESEIDNWDRIYFGRSIKMPQLDESK